MRADPQPRAAFSHAGIVLAAGASRRMGTPKALLPTPGGAPLAVRQAGLLQDAGCAKVVIVLGSERDRIGVKLDWPHIAFNEVWDRKGRISSVQTGLRALPEHEGYFILPVDAAGIRPDTLDAMLRAAASGSARAVRPTHRGQPGHLAWISAGTARHVLGMEPGEAVKLNEVLESIEHRIDVDDPAILHNPNTPEEWVAVRKQLGW